MTLCMSSIVWQNIRNYHELNRDVFEKWLAEEGPANPTDAAICQAVLDNDPKNAVCFYVQKRCFELKNKKGKTYDEAVTLQKSLQLAKQMTQDLYVLPISA